MKNIVSTILFCALTACGGGVGFQKSIDDGPGLAETGDTYTGPIHSAGGWADLLTVYVDAGASQLIEDATINVIDSWNEAVGRNIVEYGGVLDVAELQSLYGPLDDEYTVIYSTTRWGSTTAKSRGVVGTAVWQEEEDEAVASDDGRGFDVSEFIARADIILNDEDYDFQDADEDLVPGYDASKVVDAQSVITHEMGHILGLDHVASSDDSSSIMLPRATIGLGIHNRELSQGDIERIRSIYNPDALTLN